VLPKTVSNIFKRDRWMGDPLIAKCACDGTLETEFDEIEAASCFDPVKSCVSLIGPAAMTGWEIAGFNDGTTEESMDLRTWLSFHSWMAFAMAIPEAQESLRRTLLAFDNVLDKIDASKIPAGFKRLEPPQE
jgi:hypothetical protein